ncbi:MAG TPA: hypothetical protein VIJ21_07710 [Solirubrobacterales bacterium]
MESKELRCTQVAFSAVDLEQKLVWYQALGYLRSGTVIPPPEFPIAELQGLPESEPTIDFLVDSQEFFQLEIFHFRKPAVKPRALDWRPNDIGYNVVVFHVDDLDVALARLAGVGSLPVGELIGAAGERRVCVVDPDGVPVELIESEFRHRPARLRGNPRPPVACRGIRVSVPDLGRSLSFFAGTLGFERSDRELHRPEHEALWGLAGAEVETATLWAGEIAIELAQYREPAGRGWPDGYLISDQGVLNLGLASRDPGVYREAVAAVERGGYRTDLEVVGEHSKVRYARDDQGFSVELMCVEPEADRELGYIPLAVEA